MAVAGDVSDAAAVAITRAGVTDAPRVAVIGARLFTQAYGPTHPEPELSRYLARAFDVGVISAALADEDATFFLVQDALGSDIGYAWLRRSTDAPPAGVEGRRPFEIARFYVDEAWHGRGIAQALMASCVAAARDAGADVLWLATWQPATRPQAFYRRMGFEVVGATTFLFGDVVEDDVLLARRLDA